MMRTVLAGQGLVRPWLRAVLAATGAARLPSRIARRVSGRVVESGAFMAKPGPEVDCGPMILDHRSLRFNAVHAIG
jgi:hypothetical protein